MDVDERPDPELVNLQAEADDRVSPIPNLFLARELELDVALLRDQVDALQIAAAEKKRPWYRDHTVMLSVAALLLSTVFSGYTVYDNVRNAADQATEKSEAEIQSKLEKLRALMLQAATIRGEELKDQASIMASNPVLYGQQSSVRNVQRQMILESADATVNDVRDRVSAQIYNTLAFEHASDGRYLPAERYYQFAIKAASDSANAVLVSLQGLATLYMTPGSPIHDPPKGRQLYRQAVQILSHRNDEIGHYQRANSYMNLAWMEHTNGARLEASQLIKNARDEIAALSPQNPARAQLSASIDRFFDEKGFMRAAPTR